MDSSPPRAPDPRTPSDLQLLLAWKEGDRRSGSELLRRHFGAVFRFVQDKIDGDVELVVRRAFSACVERKHPRRPRTTVRAYLLYGARQQLLRRRPRANAALGPLSTTSALPTRTRAGAPAKDARRLVEHALRQLPLDAWIAIELRFLEGLSTEELAEVLDVDEMLVPSQLHAACRELHVRLRRVPNALEFLRQRRQARIEPTADDPGVTSH